MRTRVVSQPSLRSERHGVVFTRPQVVQLVLDLAGYTPTCDLTRKRLLDPACGHGAFVVPAVARLVQVAQQRGVSPLSLEHAIRAYDVNPASVAKTRRGVVAALARAVRRPSHARELADVWIREGDFLSAPLPAEYDAVVGNPPYVRVEKLPQSLRDRYRSQYRSMVGRADLYVAFIERGLRLLRDAGSLAYLCSNRWTVNGYGKALRQLIAKSFGVRVYVDLHDADVFVGQVAAYTSIFAISRQKQGQVRVATLQTSEESTVRQLRRGLVEGVRHPHVRRINSWFEDGEPWALAHDPKQLDLLKRLEARFAPIEATATVIGAGVTGNDRVFMVRDDIDVESDRLIPVVTRNDLVAGQVVYCRRRMIDTFDDEGQPIDLNDYPRLRAYLEPHRQALSRRHRVRTGKRPWYCTVDRFSRALAQTPKLVIPDIALTLQCTLEAGSAFPHHNLAAVISSQWDLQVLGALLNSAVATFFVRAYSPTMGSGYARFVPQYLRRIRLPDPTQLDSRLQHQLRLAFRARDQARIDQLASVIYGCSRDL